MHPFQVSKIASLLLLLPFSASAENFPFSTPGTVSAVFDVRLNGVPIPVIAYKDIHYAHFTLDSAAELEIVAKDSSVEKARIQPDAFGLPSIIEGNKVRFTIPRPMQLVAQLDFREKLLLFADPLLETVPADAVNALDLGVVGDGTTDNTSALQKAINTLPKSGTLLLPPGHYRSGTLHLRSDMRLHLAPGALLQAVDEHTGITPVPFSKGYIGFLVGDGLSNISITGSGTIDANGYVVRKAYEAALKIKKQSGRILYLKNSKGIMIRGVTLRDSYSWNVQVSFSDDIKMQWVKILSDVRLSNHDGIDLVSCGRVEVSDCFVFSEDDGLSPKAAEGRDIVENHVYRNIVIWAHKANGIRVGSESACKVMRNLLFENIYILNGSSGIRLDTTEGATYEDFTFRNVWIEDVLQFYDDRYQRNKERLMIEPDSRAIVLYVGREKETSPLGAISRITFENVHWNDSRVSARLDIPSALVKEIEEKKIEPPISDIIFRRCSRAGKPIHQGSDMGMKSNDGTESEGVVFEGG